MAIVVAEKRACGEVRLQDAPVLVEDEIGDRGCLVEVCAAGPRFFDDIPGLAELLVLHLQLYLVHEKLVKHLIVSPGVGGGARRSPGDERFGPCPEILFLLLAFHLSSRFLRLFVRPLRAFATSSMASSTWCGTILQLLSKCSPNESQPAYSSRVETSRTPLSIQEDPRTVSSEYSVVSALQDLQAIAIHPIVEPDVVLQMVEHGSVLFDKRYGFLRIVKPLEKSDELVDRDP